MALNTAFGGFNGNSIFRNQPPYSHFNKSFEDATDALFLALNEVHPFYMQPEQLQDDRAFESHVLLDPRTKQLVTEVHYDHTSGTQKPSVFRSGIKSSLTKKQQVSCLRVLLAWQERKAVNEADLLIWRGLERKRQQEKQEMQKFVLNYTQTHKEAIYAPAKRLVDIYKRWYARKLQALLEKQQDLAYNTHTGLPNLRACKGLTEQAAKIVDVRLLERCGRVPVLSQRFGADFRNLHHHLENYTDDCHDFLCEREEILIEAMELRSEEDSALFVVPLESLLFLLTAGDYPDLPTEVFVEICEENSSKVLKFDEPLPSRSCGWHTHKQVVEQAFTAQQAMRADTSWLRLERDGVMLEPSAAIEEINAVPERQIEFKPLTFDDYLQQHAHTHRQRGHLRAEALVKWCLKESDNDAGIQLLTTLPVAPALSDTAATPLGSLSLKLEYKPQFGCEVMTKYELLKEWLRLILLQIDEAICLRVAAENFALQLEQHLTLLHVEQQLAEIYHVNMPQQLASLCTFLKMLTNMPTGKFLLRYNPKFQNQLMLCAPSQEITQNTIRLHALLQTEPSDLCFMTQLHFLPISDSLCSIVHCYHQVMPCAFLPQLQHQLGYNLQKAKDKVFNLDPKAIQKRLIAKADLKKAELKKNSNKLAKKRKRQKQQKRKQEQKRREEAQCEKDKELDKTLFAF